MSYQKTKVEPLTVPAAFIRAIGRMLPHLKWRHHGVGMLQAYVQEGASDEIRIHIWHPELVFHGIKNRGDIHNHRFTLVSHVLAGTIYHTEVDPIPQEDGAWGKFLVTPAREQEETQDKPPGSECFLERQPGRFGVIYRSGSIRAGYTYRFPKGEYHRSWVVEPAITLVNKQNQNPTERATVLADLVEPIIHAFDDTKALDPTPYVAWAVRRLS